MVLRGSSSTTKTRLSILNLASRPSTFQDRGFVDLRPRLTDWDRGDALTEIGMRHADHGGFDHASMASISLSISFG